MNNEQAIQRVVKSAEVDRDEALFALKKTVKALSDWEPPEVTAELLADRLVSRRIWWMTNFVKPVCVLPWSPWMQYQHNDRIGIASPGVTTR